MAIETIGGAAKMLESYNAEKWVQKADMNTRFPELNEAGQLTAPGAIDGKKSFLDLLADSVGQTNNLQNEANKAMEELVTGKNKNIHETMIAVEKADIAFRTMNQVRLKVIDAYKEIMKMQV